MAITGIIKTLLPAGIRQRILLARYAGDKQECPCCTKTFSMFWPSGESADSMRPNTLCPHCSSLERHRLLWLYLQDNRHLLGDGMKVLHIAPEPIVTRLLQSLANIDYLSADLEAPEAMVRMDITNIQFPDNSFDAIVCYHVLEHVPDDRRAMQEMRRVLKPEGWAILQSPLRPELAQTYEDFTITEPEERERAFGQRDHVRLYGRDYSQRLQESGWNVEQSEYARLMSLELQARYSIDANEDIYLCR